MNRKFVIAVLAVTASTTITSCHHAAPHHAHKASAPAPGPAASGSVQQSFAELNSIPTRPSTTVSGYVHDDWARADGACNTRAYLLLNTGTGVTASKKKCTVQTGRWHDAYGGPDLDKTGKTALHDPSRGAQVDHMVPLHRAQESGASQWSPRLWSSFVNDLQGVDDRHPGDPRARETVVANASLNMKKGDHPPNEWLPPMHQCTYTADYVHVQSVWNKRAEAEGHYLSMNPNEKAGIKRVLDGCSKEASR